jgi:Cys-rich protein (TIGR01571 family)
MLIVVGQTSERIRDPSMQALQMINVDCLIHGALWFATGCGWVYAMLKRTEIRERFGITGSIMEDCCATYWCHCCAIIQHDNEVKSRLPPPIAGLTDQPYQPQQEDMSMPQAPAPLQTKQKTLPTQ